MLPDRVSNPGPLTYESGALPIAVTYVVIYLLTRRLFCGYTTLKVRFLHQIRKLYVPFQFRRISCFGEANRKSQNLFSFVKVTQKY